MMKMLQTPMWVGLLLVIMCTSAWADTSADDLMVGFHEKDKIRLKNIGISSWQSQRRDDDKGRLVAKADAGNDNEAMVDVEAFKPGKRFDHLLLRVFVHGDYHPEKMGKIVISVSDNGVTYMPVQCKYERESKWDGGWYRYRFTLKQDISAFRYVKLQFQDLTVSWKIELADLWLGLGHEPQIPEKKDAATGDGNAQPSASSLLPDGQTSDLSVPQYPLRIATTGPSSVTVDRLLICPLDQNDEQLHPLALSRYPWIASQITDREFRTHTWNNHAGLKGKITNDTRVLLYRFGIDYSSWDGRGRLVLELDQSAFVTTLWVDGNPGPTRREGLLPIVFDLTQFAEQNVKAKTMDIVLRVEDYHNQIRESDNYPTMPLGAMYKWTKGICIPPRITTQASVVTENSFVFSDVLQNRLTAQCQLVNHADHPLQGVLRQRITGLDGQVLLQHEQPFDLQAGQSMPLSHQYTITQELQRWDVGKPNLYLAVNQVIIDNKVVDDRSTRFGYRTVSVAGEDVLLNGRKIQLIGPWAHIGEWSWPLVKDNDLHETFRILLKYGMNYGRLHGQPYPRPFYDAADETGFLLVAESGLFHRPIADISLEHIRNMALTLRNHPSIVMWSGSNEFEHWITPRPEMTQDFLIKVYDVFKSIDPTRPVFHSGFGDARQHFDAYSIHYPEDVRSYPMGLHWKASTPDRIKTLYRQNYTANNPVGIKPILVGEQMTPGRSRELEALYGEACLKLVYQSQSDPHARNQWLAMQGKFWRDMVREYRQQNIAMLSPNMMYLKPQLESDFLKEMGKECRGVSCYIFERDPVLVTGTSQPRTLRLEDTDGWPDQGQVHVTIVVGNKPVFSRQLAVSLQTNEVATVPISFDLPMVEHVTDGLLQVAFMDSDTKAPRYTWEHAVRLYPLSPSGVQRSQPVTVWQNQSATADLLKRLGVKVVSLKTLEKQVILGTLVIDTSIDDTTLAQSAKQLQSHVVAGGNVLLLWRKQIPQGLLPVSCERVEEALPGATIGFMRAAGHRLFEHANFSDLDLQYWDAQTGLVAQQTLYKPTHGNFTVLVDAGVKLDDALLVEIRHGKGRYWVCQLDVVQQADTHRAARKLLAAMLEELDSPAGSSLQQGYYLAPAEPYTANLLDRMGWKSCDINTSGVSKLLIDEKALQHHGVRASEQLAGRANVVIFKNTNTPQATAIALALTSHPLKTRSVENISTMSKTAIVPYLQANYPVLDGLSSADLNWFQRRYQPATCFEPSDHWQIPVSNGALAVYQSDDPTPRKTIVLDNLPWTQEVDFPDQRDRFLSTFFTGLGIQLVGQPVQRTQNAGKLVNLDLKPVCNASISQYLGPNVPRAQQQFDGIPFRLLSEAAAQPFSMLRFNARVGTELENSTILFDTPIDRFEVQTPLTVTLPMHRMQASHLYFAHAATRNWKIIPHATGTVVYRVTVQYEDGTSELITMLMGRDIDDCRSAGSQSRNSAVGLRVSNPNNGNGEVATLYVSTWTNPYPERKITALKIISAQNPPYDPMLFAITARQSEMAFE